MSLTDSQIFDQQQAAIAGRDAVLLRQAKSRVSDVLSGPLTPAKLFAAYGKGAAAQLTKFLAAVDYLNACEPNSVDKASLAFTANSDGTVTVA